MSTYHYPDHPDYDSIKRESDAEKRASRRHGGWCPVCRQYGHAHGCPEAPEPIEIDETEDE